MNNTEIETGTIFYNVYKQNINIKQFTNWLYYKANEIEINNHYGCDYYFELINIDYTDKYAYSNLCNILESKIDFGYQETQKILSICSQLINKEGNVIELLSRMYDLYCNGYSFLRFLGLSYVSNGLDNKKNNESVIICNIQGRLISEAVRLKEFLELKQIVIIDEFQYKDNRELKDRIELTDINSMLNYD